MRELLVRTKYTLPPLRARRVTRPRLLERLDAALLAPLTLITAAAGFGKTTLVSDWIAERDVRAAWLALDAEDNDPTRLLHYLVAALECVDPGRGEEAQALLQLTPPPLPPLVLTALVNEWSGVATPTVVVLDDYHVIENEALHEAFAYWIEHLPSVLHVIVTSRHDPPFPLARWRARNQLNELRAADLRFTAAEAGEFLNAAMGLALPPPQVAALEARTEGWIVGLQLAALSLRGGTEAAPFVESFSGSHRYIISYLVEEVLRGQPAAIETFLLDTCLLERMNAALCDAVTGRTEAAMALAYLDEHQLFVIALDDQGEWYRYHPLFAEALYTRLKQSRAEASIRALHQRASEWFHANGLAGEAVQHALHGADWSRAAQLIQAQAERLWQRGEMATLERWLKAVPESFMAADPGLLLVQAMTLVLTKPAEQARIGSLVEQARQSLDRDDPDTRELRGRLTAVASANASNQTDTARTIRLGQEALHDLAPDSLFWRALTETNLGIAYATQGEPRRSAAALEQAAALAQRAGIPYLELFARMHLAYACLLGGKLHAAHALFEKCIADATARHMDRLPLMGYLCAGQGRLLYEWNRLEASRALLERARGLIDAHARPWVWVGIDADLAQIALAHGDSAEARTLFQDAAVWIESSGLAWAAPLLSAYEARAAVRQGAVAAAAAWARTGGLTARDEIPYQREYEYLTLARVLIAQGETGEAEALLARLAGAAQQAGRETAVIETAMLHALALARAGDAHGARQKFRTVLAQAESEGRVRLLVDEGEPLRALFRETAAQHAERRSGRPRHAGQGADERRRQTYVANLMAAWSGRESPVQEPAPQATANSLIEPLSERELEVLRLIARGASNQEVAAALVIAVPTVKRHLSNIYAKLAVASRTAAVARAREYKLL